jgi:hypothetical protein
MTGAFANTLDTHEGPGSEILPTDSQEPRGRPLRRRNRLSSKELNMEEKAALRFWLGIPKRPEPLLEEKFFDSALTHPLREEDGDFGFPPQAANV